MIQPEGFASSPVLDLRAMGLFIHFGSLTSLTPTELIHRSHFLAPQKNLSARHLLDSIVGCRPYPLQHPNDCCCDETPFHQVDAAAADEGSNSQRITGQTRHQLTLHTAEDPWRAEPQGCRATGSTRAWKVFCTHRAVQAACRVHWVRTPGCC